MPRPNDASLRLTLGSMIGQALRLRVERLISKPNERDAGYIDALRDVQRMMNDGELPDFDYASPPTQEPPRAS